MRGGYEYLYVYKHTYIYVYTHTRIYIYTSTYICTYIHIYTLHVCIYVCVYIVRDRENEKLCVVCARGVVWWRKSTLS